MSVSLDKVVANLKVTEAELTKIIGDPLVKVVSYLETIVLPPAKAAVEQSWFTR